LPNFGENFNTFFVTAFFFFFWVVFIFGPVLKSFCLLFDGSSHGHQSFIGFLYCPWAGKKIFGIWVAQKSALICEFPRHETHGFFFFNFVM
jgi:hypothetical protein